MDFEGVDLEAAMDAVVADMGRVAMRAKGQKYAPKPPPKAEEPAPEPEDESGMPTASELESLLGE